MSMGPQEEANCGSIAWAAASSSCRNIAACSACTPTRASRSTSKRSASCTQGRPAARFRAYAGVAKASAITYTATFNDSTEGWDQNDNRPSWGSTGGQDGGGYAGGVRNGLCPYLTPPLNSILYGDLAANFGSRVLRFSYYLKNFGGSPSDGGKLYMFADCDGDGDWDTAWQWTPSDASVPHEWRQYAWTVDTAADAAPAGWTRVSGSGSWADTWKHVKCWNFWSGGGSGQINNGIDTVVVVAPATQSCRAGPTTAREPIGRYLGVCRWPVEVETHATPPRRRRCPGGRRDWSQRPVPDARLDRWRQRKSARLGRLRRSRAGLGFHR